MRIIWIWITLGFTACGSPYVPGESGRVEFVGSIEELDRRLYTLIEPEARMIKLAEGFTWAEGPVWVPATRMLLFSDVPENTIYKWSEKNGLNKWLTPSGYTGEGEYSKEPGSNGLILDQNGDLLLAQHGDRRIARMSLKDRLPSGQFQTLADTYEDRRFNSPNDLVLARDGSIYFTDPPYGLPGKADSPLRELPFQGVYHIDGAGVVHDVIDNLSRPNGIGLSPDGNTLYVANSDPAAPHLYAYDRAPDGSVSNRRIFFDADEYTDKGPGVPDGLAVDKDGNVFATGPGGVYVLDPTGRPLGLLNTGRATANVTIGNNGKMLYITADDVLLRVPLRKPLR